MRFNSSYEIDSQGLHLAFKLDWQAMGQFLDLVTYQCNRFRLSLNSEVIFEYGSHVSHRMSTKHMDRAFMASNCCHVWKRQPSFSFCVVASISQASWSAASPVTFLLTVSTKESALVDLTPNESDATSTTLASFKALKFKIATVFGLDLKFEKATSCRSRFWNKGSEWRTSLLEPKIMFRF